MLSRSRKARPRSRTLNTFQILPSLFLLHVITEKSPVKYSKLCNFYCVMQLSTFHNHLPLVYINTEYDEIAVASPQRK